MIKTAFRRLIKPYLRHLKSDLAVYFDDKNKEQLIHVNQNLSAGWYTIAYVAANKDINDKPTGIYQRAYASFVITEKKGGQHQTLHFDAGHTYGNASVINVLGTSSYDDPKNVISKIRIKALSTYDGAVIQIYVASASHIETIKMYNNLQLNGWTLCKPILANSDAEKSTILPIMPKLNKYALRTFVDINSRYLAMISSGDIRAKNIDINNGALILNRSGTNNIDHIHSDDATNTIIFVYDGTYKSKNATANIAVKNAICESLQAGDASPKIAFKKITGLYNDTQKSRKVFAHGLDHSKIIGVHILVHATSAYSVPPNYSPHANSNYTYIPTSTGIVIAGIADANLLNKPLTIFIIYEV